MVPIPVSVQLSPWNRTMVDITLQSHRGFVMMTSHFALQSDPVVEARCARDFLHDHPHTPLDSEQLPSQRRDRRIHEGFQPAGV